MKVRIKRQPTGYISLDGGPLQAWPAKGAVVEVPDVIAQDLIAADVAEKVTVVAKVTDKIETRPAPKAEEETRAVKPSVAVKKPAASKASGAKG